MGTNQVFNEFITICFDICMTFVWIRKEAEVEMEGSFLVRLIYDDEITYNLVEAAERVLSNCLKSQEFDRKNKKTIKNRLKPKQLL